jgi:hypothetical protein
MKPAALGFRVHSGWTALIAIALEKNLPVILARQRPHLVATFSYTFRQPYHTAEKMELSEAQLFLKQQQAEARRLASQAIRTAQSEIAQQGYAVVRATLLTASGRPLPRLEKILRSHSIIHTADGEFFRNALLHACTKAGLSVNKIKDRDICSIAASSLRRSAPTLTKFLNELGKPFGAPWTQDEKFATLAAWLAIKSFSRLA